MEKRRFKNVGQGCLFRNQNKQSTKSPDYTGTIEIEGYEYSISGWLNTTKKDGTKYLSLKISKEILDSGTKFDVLK